MKRTFATIALGMLVGLTMTACAQPGPIARRIPKGTTTTTTRLCTAKNPYYPCKANGDNEPIRPFCRDLTDAQYEGYLSDICIPTTYTMDEAGKVPKGCCNQPDILDVRLEPLDPQTDSPKARCDNMGGILLKGKLYDICHDVDY